MPLLNDDPLTQVAFSIYENKGVFALLLGSGLSRAAEIPTGWDITLDLVRRVATAKGVAAQTDWAAWHRAEVGGEPDYSALLAELATTPAERRAILDGYIEPTEGERERGAKVPTAAHRAIARLVADGYTKVIITTNFDRLMENALREAGVEPVVVASPDALAGAQPLAHSPCYILKVHGDYKDERILNTDEELSKYPATYDNLLDRIMDEYGLIVCGWSGVWDKALRAAILRAPNRRYTTYWATRGAVATEAQDLVDHRRAKVIQIADADNFFNGLAERVKTLETTRAQNPLSVEMTVSMAKRYIARPEYRIALDDLIALEGERIIRAIQDQETKLSQNIDGEQFQALVAHYQAAAEPMARVAGVFGRWGDGSDRLKIVSLLRGLINYVDKSVYGGSVVRLNMRLYPALLILTAYGLGLTRSKRLEDLRSIMTEAIRLDRRGESRRLVNVLFNRVSSDGEGDFWQALPGLNGHVAPISTHLFATFDRWRVSFDPGASSFPDTFSMYEGLSSLLYFEGYSAEDMSTSIRNIQERRGQGWQGLHLPITRCAWDTDAHHLVTTDLQDNGFREVLTNAGFAKGGTAVYSAFLMNLRHLAACLRFR